MATMLGRTRNETMLEQVYGNVTGTLKGQAFFSTAVSFGVQQSLGRNGSVSLAAGALAYVTVVIEGVVRPIFQEIAQTCRGQRNDLVDYVVAMLRVGVAVVGAAALLTACGAPMTAFKVSEMVFTNCIIRAATKAFNLNPYTFTPPVVV